MIRCLCWALALTSASVLWGQTGTSPAPLRTALPDETKEELLNRLKLQEAQLLVREALAARERYARDYEEMKRLFDEKTLTLKELNDAKKVMEDSELEYQRALINLERTKLEFLKDATHLTIMQAKKYRTENNQRRVDITIRNNSNVELARTIMRRDGRDVDESMLGSLLKVENIIVSLIDVAVIAEPYEIIIPSLATGEQKVISFQLLKDVDELEVRIKYLDAVVSERVFLKKESVHELPTISSPQSAQEGNLGSKVTFDLELEMLVESERNFALFAINLPKQIQVAFVDPKNQARITQVRFSEQMSKQQLRAEVSIPEKLDRSYVDKQIDFSIFVAKMKDLKQVRKLRKEHENGGMPQEEVGKIPGNHADLQLTPRGVGQLEVLIANLYEEIQIGENVDFQIQILNSGTLTLNNCETEVDLPLNWDVQVEPRRVAEILAGNKKPITLVITPPADVGVGNYEIKIKAKGETGTEQIESTVKNFQVRVGAKTNIVGSVILVAVLILIVLGIAVVSIRISRA